MYIHVYIYIYVYTDPRGAQVGRGIFFWPRTSMSKDSRNTRAFKTCHLVCETGTGKHRAWPGAFRCRKRKEK